MMKAPVELKSRIARLLSRAQENQEKAGLRLLLENMSAYLLRHSQTPTGKKRGSLEPYPGFDGRGDSYSRARATEIQMRLRLVDERQLTSPERIVHCLLSGLKMPAPWALTEHQVSILRRLDSEPDIGLVALARSLSSTPRTVRNELRLLSGELGFHVGAAIDPQRFQLRHYGIWFQAQTRAAHNKLSEWLFNEADSVWPRPYHIEVASDIHGEEGYLTLIVPAQGGPRFDPRALFRGLKDEFVQAAEIHEIQGSFQSVCLNAYDYVSKRWKIDADLMTEGALQLVRRRGPVFSDLPGLSYNPDPIRFDRADWLIALTHCGLPLTKFEQRTLLAHHGKPLSSKSIWAREARLRRAQAVYPRLAFSSVIFDSYILCVLVCSAAATATVSQIVSQLPFSCIHPSDKGAIVAVGTPEGGPGLAKHLTQMLLRVDEIERLAVLRIDHYAPPLLPMHWAAHWDYEHQRWTSVAQT